MTTGFLDKKWCPSLDTYPRSAGARLGFLGACKIGKVQYEGWPVPPAVAECSDPGSIRIIEMCLDIVMGHKSTSTHGITAMYGLNLDVKSMNLEHTTLQSLPDHPEDTDLCIGD
jgi:hypothetical protein